MFTFMSEEVERIDPCCPVHGGQSFDDARKEAESSLLRIHQIATLSRRLEGKMLTICDAIISDDRQNKAIKDLVRDALREFRARAEQVSEGYGDEYSVGVSTLDIEETEEGFKIPTTMPPVEEDKA